MNANPPYQAYADVPWYRRSNINSTVLFLQLLTLPFFPVALWVCVVLLTGDIYFDKADAGGQLRRWGLGNKIVALAVLGACLTLIIFHPFRRAW